RAPPAAQGPAPGGAGVGAALLEEAFVEQVAAPRFVLHGAGYRAYECGFARSPQFFARGAKNWGGAARGGTAPPRRQETGGSLSRNLGKVSLSSRGGSPRDLRL